MTDYNSKQKMLPSKRLIFIIISLIITTCVGLVIHKSCKKTYVNNHINGNILNIPYGATWDESNIITSPWKNLQFHVGLLYRSLFSTDSTQGNIELDMVNSYKVLDDGMTYKFDLLDNLLWSDGEPITPNDVVFSIEAVLLARDCNGIYTSAFSNIKGANDFISGDTEHISGIHIDGNTITLKMERVYPSLIDVLAQFVILPKHCLENEDLVMLHLNNFWSNPVVSGMYKFGQVTPYKSIQLVKNKYYIGTPPKIDEVMIQLDYKHADLDYHTTNNSTEIINYRSMKSMDEYEVDVLLYRYLVFNLQGSAENKNNDMKNETLRHAISYAINRDKLLKDIYFDFGNLIDSGVPRSSDDYNRNTIEYNVEKAKDLLEHSGYDTSRPLRLAYYYSDSVSKYFMESIASNLREVGFNVELVHLKVASEIYEERNYDILLKGLSAFGLNEWYSEYTTSNTNMSKLFVADEEFELLIQKFNSEIDEDVAHETLLELQALEQNKMYKLPLFTLNQMVYIRSDRLSVPKDIVFKNSWFKYDVDFEDWYIKSN